MRWGSVEDVDTDRLSARMEPDMTWGSCAKNTLDEQSNIEQAIHRASHPDRAQRQDPRAGRR